MHSPNKFKPPGEAESPKEVRGPRRWLFDVGLAIAVALGLGIVIYLMLRPEPLPDGISPAEFERAERLFYKSYGKRADRRDVFSYLGELSAEAQDWNTALICFQQIPSDDLKYGSSARLQEAQILLDLNRAAQAEAQLRKFLKLAEREPRPSTGSLRAAYERLAYLLSVELRFEDRKPILAAMHDLGIANVNESKQFYFPNLLIWRSTSGRNRLREFLAEDDSDLPLLIAQGRYLTAEGNLDQARSLLESLFNRAPENPHVASALLECYFETGDQSSFEQCLNSLPRTLGEDSWLMRRMRGELALSTKNWNDAVTHFRAVLKHDPANPESHMGLAKAYDALGQTDKRDEMLRRSKVLAKIRVFLSNITEETPKECLELAQMCEQIEMHEAAQTYREHAGRISRTNNSPTIATQKPKGIE